MTACSSTGPVVSARKLNAETTMTPDHNKFLSNPGRVKHDWDLALKQIERKFERGDANPLPESMYSMLLEQIEFERLAYRDEIFHAYGSRHRRLHEQHSTEPEWPRLRAEHWNAFRAEVRARRRWLDTIEERLDEAFLKSVPSNA